MSRGVFPKLLLALTSGAAAARTFTLPKEPFFAALCKGVLPSIISGGFMYDLSVQHAGSI